MQGVLWGYFGGTVGILWVLDLGFFEMLSRPGPHKAYGFGGTSEVHSGYFGV